MSIARAAVALLALLASAHAAEQLVPGHRLALRRSPSGRERLLFIARSPSLAAPAPGSADDPTQVGATLGIRAGSGETAVLDLPPSLWSRNASGTAYRFRNRTAPAGPSPVRLAMIRDRSGVRVMARTTGITLDEATQGSIGLLFTTGSLRYCALFDGASVMRDAPGVFSARRAPAPASCPGMTPTTSTSSTSSTIVPTTTTSTSLLPPFCGNLTVDTGEQCDPPGTACGTGLTVCGADCTCPCDYLDPSVCMHPFPNDWFTVPDPSSATGRRVHFSLAGMPRNAAQKPIEPGDYNMNDGFSPGASIVLRIPNVDLGVTGAAPITDIERSLDPGAPVVLVNASTLAHHLSWAEIDSNAATEANRAVIIRPAINLQEGTRYIVALRNIKNSGGALIAPNPDFLAYRDGTPTGDAMKEARRPHMEDLFTTLAAAGVPRATLYLAWDFTVSSATNIAGRMLHIRDDAFASLGAGAPTFVVGQIDNGTNGAGVDGSIYRRVTGTYLVPRYVTTPLPGARFLLGPDGLPIRQPGDQPANFTCNIPRAALASATATAIPGRAGIYGHGLFGSASEVSAGNVEAMGNEHSFVSAPPTGSACRPPTCPMR